MSKMTPRMLAGTIAVAALVELGLMAVPAHAATFTVTTTAEVVDAGDGFLSLREAVDQANTSAGDDEIVLPAGVHALSIPGTGGNNNNNNNNADGDLDHLDTGQLTIRGAGLDVTYIDAAGLSDRILDMRDGALVVEDLTVRNGDVVGGGGAIRVTGAATATLTASRFDGNHSDTNGGAVRSGQSIAATGSLFSGNTSDGAGGALYGPGPHDVSGSFFDGNTAQGNGGAIWDSDAALTISDSTFRANSSPGNGGALRHRDGPLTIVNSTFDANTAASGAAVWTRHAATSLTHVTIAGGATRGGALHAGGSATVTFASTVIAPDSGAACSISGTIVSSGSNAATDASCGLTAGSDQNGTAVPDLQALADNGGTTLTRLPGASSTLTDAATCAAATDQRGITRPDGAQCEIGAVELRIPVPQPDAATTPQDTAINVDVADNDTVYDDHVDLTSVATTSGPTNGSTTDVGDGTITYTPLPGWWGTDTFTYELCGPGESACNTAVATITVTAAPTTTTTTTSTTVPPTTAPPTTSPATTAPATTVPSQAKPAAQDQATTPTSLPATGPTHAERLTVLAAAFLFVGMTVLLLSSGARRHPSRAVFRPQDGGWTRD